MVEQSSIREIKLKFNNAFVLNLISFLSQEEDYSFVGNESELWLENLSHPKAQLIYINHEKEFTLTHAHYISEKAKVITDQIKRNYLMPHINVLILNIEASVDVAKVKLEKDVEFINVKDAEEAKGNQRLGKYFPAIKEANLTMDLLDAITQVQYQTLEKTIRKAKLLTTTKKVTAIKAYLLLLSVFFVYLLFRLTPETTVLIAVRYGAAYSPLIVAGQYWRLMTTPFLHLDLIHLLLNAIFIFRFGEYVEAAFGKVRTLFIILVSGLMSSLFAFAFSEYAAIGATGVAYGLLGAMVFLSFEERKMFMPIARRTIFPILLITVLFSIVFPQVGTIAHIGGAIGGFLGAAMLGILAFKPFLLRSFLTALTFLILGSSMIVRGLGRPITNEMEAFNHELIQYYRELGNDARANELSQLFEIEVE